MGMAGGPQVKAFLLGDWFLPQTREQKIFLPEKKERKFGEPSVHYRGDGRAVYHISS